MGYSAQTWNPETLTPDVINASDFGFSIPAGAVVNGTSVSAKASSPDSVAIRPDETYVTTTGAIGNASYTNNSGSTVWLNPTTNTVIWYGTYTNPNYWPVVPSIPLPSPAEKMQPLDLLEPIIASEVERRVKQELAKRRKEQVEALPPLVRPRKINLEELPD